MIQRLTILSYLFLLAIFVAGLGLSAQGLGPSHAMADSQPKAGESCCQTDPSTQTNPISKANDLDGCPDQEPDQECPKSCPCSCCKVMTRTVNLFSSEVPLMQFFASRVQRLCPMPYSVPASAVLSVDIQPPIA